jgi:hypothetical protein
LGIVGRAGEARLSRTETGEAILRDVHAFAQSDRLSDDVCLLLARRLG